MTAPSRTRKAAGRKPTNREVNAAHAVLLAARDAEEAQRAEADRKYIGKCFCYRNSYSTGDSWNLYAIVTHMDDHRTLRGWKFQKDNDGRINIETNEPLMSLGRNSGYVAILAEEFWREASKLCAELSALMEPNR